MKMNCKMTFGNVAKTGFCNYLKMVQSSQSYLRSSRRVVNWAIPENIHTPHGRHRIGYLKISGFPRRTTAVFAGFQSLLIQNLEEFQNFAKI